MRSGQRGADAKSAEPQTARASSELLSPGERALWFLHRLAPGSAAYNLAGAVRIAHLDAAALRRAVLRVVERHPALRTTFPADPSEGGEPRRRVQGWLEPEIVEEDVTGLTCRAAYARLEEEALRPFDPEHGPLLRVRIFRRDGHGGGVGAALFVFHHLVADFWSLTVILRELGEIYGEETGGPAAELLPPAPLYEQWVERQALELGGPRGEALRAFWLERLAGPVPILDLPADRPRPAAPSGAGVGGAGRLGAEVTARLQALARGRGATLFAAVLAGYQLLLHRITGDEDVWIGVPAAGRGPARWSRTVGYFVNPVVLRGRPREAASYAALLDRARAESEEALAHRDWPFPWLAEELHPVRDAGRMPLFQAMLVLYRTRYPEEEPLALLALGEGGGAARLGGLAFETLPLGRRGAQLDVSLTAAVIAGELRLRLELDADRFDAATAGQLLGRLEALLEGATERPHAAVDDLPLLREAERQALFLEWNDPRAAAPVPGSLDALVAAQADRTPQATALVCNDRRLTYRELLDRAARLARHLRSLGAGPETRVGICAGRSPELVVGILAILRAGAAYVPLDPAYPEERLAWILEDSTAALLLAESSRLPLFSAARLAERGVRTVLLEADDGGAGASEELPRPLPLPPASNRLAYVLYTSGSTGQPKGVALEHAGALVLLRWAGGLFAAEDLAGVVASTSIGFDLSVFELFLPLSRGGTVLLVPDALHAAAVPGATLINTVPSAMAELVRFAGVPATVRVVCLAGERLPASLAAAVRRAAPGCRVLNLYGPTEATTYSTWSEVEPEDGREPAIGRPVDGTRVHLLDRWLRPLPPGVAGELFLAGSGLARGYVGRPDLTAGRFVPDPWSPEPGGRLYRTGDLGRRRPDGVLEILGRLDQQVKLRGFRIELGEVAAALEAHPDVREAAVEVREDAAGGGAAGDRRLVAWIGGEGGDAGPASSARLRDFLSARLPGPMVPAVFGWLPALPRTANGKVDRRALAARPLPAPLPAAGYVPPRSSVEDWLAGLFAEVLGRPQIGAEDDFFACGGHSLLATRLLARVRAVFGVDLPLRTLFTAPTVARLAAAIAAARDGGPGRRAEGSPLRPAPRNGALPLSFSQRRLWVLHQITPGLTAYHIPARLRLRGRLDVAALERALGEIVRRHEALRTSFPVADGEPVQEVSPFADFRLAVADLSALPEERREKAARSTAEVLAHRSFDLERGPLLRLLLLRSAPGEHDLALVVHHLVFDGWSAAVFLRELSVLYAAFLRGFPSPLPEPELQYADWALWQRAWLRGGALEEQLRWWRDRLASAPRVLDLPTDFPYPPVETHAGAAVPVRLPEALVAGARALGQREGATLFMVLLAAFQALLARLSGQETVSTGTHAAGRNRVESEDLIGFFVNTVVVRTDLDGTPSGGELIARVRDGVLGAFAHQDVPFEKLVEELNPARDLRRSPLFQVAVTLQNLPREAPRLPGLEAEILEVRQETAQYELSLLLSEEGPGVSGELRYNTDLFAGPTVLRLVRSWEACLGGLAADPGAPASSLPLLGAAERHQLLIEWSGPEHGFPEPVLGLPELFAERAAQAPAAAAVLCGEDAITYRELDQRSNQLARWLRRQGIGPEKAVAISVERSVEMVVGLLGILKAGAAYLPIDPHNPRERQAFQLDDGGASILLTQEGRAAGFEAPGRRTLRLDADWSEVAREDSGAVPSRAGPENVIALLYTSGSTGRPKATVLEGRGLLNLCRWYVRVAPIAPHTRSLLGLSFSFDAAFKNILGPLLAGGQAILPPPGPFDAGEMLSAIRHHAVTFLCTTPSQLLAILQLAAAEGFRGLETLETLILTGEAARWGELRPWLRSGRCHAEILNMYGPSEASDTVSCHRATPDEIAAADRLPAGRPADNTRLLVLDADLQPLPVGAPGELCLAGAGLARGYRARPGMTAEKFVPDPWGAGERMYRTGDLARWRPDGSIELLGRIDHQVKIRGVRVEPLEVEAALSAHPAVAGAVVGPREDRAGEMQLIAWIVPAEGAAPPSAASLRGFLRERLPDVMIPSAFVFLDLFPVTPRGKIDRGALAGLPPGPTEEVGGAPRDPAEELMAGLWTEVLGREGIGRGDDFFALGGHSLLATRLAARVRAAFGIDLPVRKVFEHPALAALTGEVGRLARGGRATLPPPRPRPHGAVVPLSFAQSRLWVLHQLDPGLRAYHVPAAVRLRGGLDVAALERALGEVVRRHEALRTSFPLVHGNPVQAIARAGGFLLAVVDVSSLPEDRREAAARQIGETEARRPFDLESGPLLRLLLLRLGAAEHVLLLVVHHLVFDGWSAAVFLRELSILYAAFLRGEPSPLPEPRLQYADWALWQREQLRGEVLEEQLRWWRDRLESAPRVLDLPTDFPHPPLESHAGASVPVRLPEALAAASRSLGRAEGATLFMVLLAAFQALLARLAGQETICTGTHVAGRDRLESEDLIGFFVNTLVIRIDLDGSLSGRDLIARVREEVLGAFAHQDLPFEKLVEALNPVRDLGRSPLFQAAFTLQNTPQEDLRLPGLAAETLEMGPDAVQYDLSLALVETGEGLAGRLWYRTALFVEPTVRRLAGQLESLLAALVEEPGARVSTLPLLTRAERHQILTEWTGPERGGSEEPGPGLLELFARQAARAPEAVAVVCGEAAVSYGALDRLSDQLARWLRRHGAGPETAVAIAVERSMEMMAGLLGILKAGAAYLPIDPLNPRDRQAFQMDDAGARILLTQERWAAGFQAAGRLVLRLDADRDEIAREQPGALPPLAGPGNVMAFLYTSGSTGRPKATVVPERGLLNLCRWYIRAARLGPGTRSLLALSFSFDAAFKNLVGPLLAGGRIVLPPPGAYDAGEMLEAVRRHGVDFLCTTPGQLGPILLRAAAATSSSPAEGWESLETLETLILGGEAARWAELGPWLASGRCRAAILHMYGPSEASDTVACHRVAPEEILAGADRLPVGRPVDETRLLVVDAGLEPLPIGVPGELCAAGAGLARGYHARPGLTAERFVPDPWGCGERMYRTGDLAVWRADGSVEILGRIDQQVKIRGVRVEPFETEAVLLAHPAIHGAVVGTQDAVDGKRLIAWIVPAQGAELPPERALRNVLRERLPDVMIPAAFVPVEAFPRTPRGKVDRSALARLSQAGSPLAEAPMAPRTQAEEVLAWLWCEVLELPRIGIHDDFFERGGHSLLAARLLTRVRSVFGVDLPLRTVFAAPTVARMADAIAAARRSGFGRLEDVAVEPVPRTGPLPLSFAQERLWFIDQWIPLSPAYNIPAAVRLRGPLDVGALRSALAEIVRRHETLRTTFTADGGHPVQIIHPGLEVPLPVIDLERQDEAGEAWRTLAGDEARRGFDLWRGPLLRTTLLRLAAADHVLVVNLHHIVADGWSMGVLIEELRALYAAFLDRHPSPLPGLPVQYVDWAVWQRRLLEREALTRGIEWWRSFLAGAPAALELPADRPRPLWSIHRGAVEPVVMPPALAARLRELAHREDVTLFMLLLSAFEVLLARLTGVEDLVVGTAVAQRTPEVEGLIGLFVNLLPLRGDLAGDPPFTALLARTRLSTLEAHDHQDVPFERLVAALEPVRDPGRHPLFQAALTLQNVPRPEAILPGLDLEIEQLDTGTARFDLTLVLHETDGGLAGALEHSADLFDQATMWRLLGSFGSLLTGLAEDPGRPVSRLPLMSAAERRQILEVWSGPEARTDPTDLTDRSDPSDRSESLHHLFARQAARTPDAVALIDRDAEMTYRELDRRSALLARRLRAAGAGPDVPVAVLLERSADMVVALLGVLRAGSGYVPLDLGYPRERLAWMLEDSGARLVVTRGGLVSILAAHGLDAVRIDDLPEDVPDVLDVPDIPVGPDRLAYIIYTSGSTGKPKGVASTHRAVARVVIDPGYAELGPEETILQLAPVPFDASTFEIWGALLNGGRLAVFPAGPVSLRDLARALSRDRVTTLFLTTGLFHQMIDEEPEALAGVRQLITGGDVISVARARRAVEALPGCRLIHAYGPTESTTFATCHTVTRADTTRPTLTLGRPIRQTSVWLLDERLEPVPPGVPGELYLGGEGLARGYWRRPDQTAERFVPHPFASRPGERLYRTGDLARWLPDGTVDFLGRIDRQVKIRGFRVEPAEIETTLERHPGLLAAVVQPRDDSRGNRRLVAWIVPASPGSEGLSDAELLAWCRERLPAFMVPGSFVLLEALPLDPNGKVDRRALPDPDPGLRGSYLAPRTPLEAQVAGVWAEVLGQEHVGAEDDFFELGGHSLLATQIVARLERELGLEIGLRAFFDEPTVAGVALAITREQMRQEDPERIERLLAQVQELSPEELAKLLREEGV